LETTKQASDTEENAQLRLFLSTIVNPKTLLKIVNLEENPTKIRNGAVAKLKKVYQLGADRISQNFKKTGTNSRPIISAYSQLTDQILNAALFIAKEITNPPGQKNEPVSFAVLAVGGYGREEMAPYSDVDLLFITSPKTSEQDIKTIETTLYILWDLKLKVGYSTRNIKECLNLAKEDFTIRTALLELRYLYGSRALAEELDSKLWSSLFNNSAAEFISAKLLERFERLKRHGGQRYTLEPNIKEGKGGLRDLQSLFWIAKYVRKVKSVEALVELKVFTVSELNNFKAAEDFLWAARSHVHLITGRATEQLTFDLQVEVAERMGFLDHDGRRSVEHFMQAYFKHATRVGEFTRIILTDIEAQYTKSLSPIIGFFKNSRRKKPRLEFRLRHNRIDVVNIKVFETNPLNLLILFEEALRTGYLIHPDTMRLVSTSLGLFVKLRGDKKAAKVFLDTLLKHGNPERALRRMNELGVLGAFIPYFQNIVAMMQFNMYHSYTVDEHTIQVISNLSQIERGQLTETLPIVSNILEGKINRRVLYVSLLFHDLGKGREEDHSILGAKIAREVVPTLGLNADECDTVEWLVRNHLLMADMAQKRDISDPRTVRDFAKAVKSVKRLDLLTVLTVCDIRGVGENIWNNWKATLIRALYRQTRRALEDGMEALNREQRGAVAKQKLREVLSKWDRKILKVEIERHYPPYWQGLHVTAHIDFANMLIDLIENEIKISLTPDEDRDATRACFAMHDHPGIFSRISGALALVGANVVDARAYTSKDGYGTNTFWVQDSHGHPYEIEKLSKLKLMLQKTLKGEIIPREALRDKIKKRERDFNVPTSITFNNDGSDIYTIIEVDTRDRRGLLYDLSKTLSNANIYIASAVISTYGVQVVDTFYVKDMFGLKFYSKTKQASIEKKLKEAIFLSFKRAEQ
jgi:[protein-PII] uridylyltransferase